MATSKLIAKQWLKIKNSIVNINNQLNRIFPFFSSLNKKILVGFQLIDTFLNCFSFFSVNRKNSNSLSAQHRKLDNLHEDSLINQDTVFIITDMNIINNIATSISHIWREQDIIAKMVHHTTNINFMEAKLFAIKCRINYVYNYKTSVVSLLL